MSNEPNETFEVESIKGKRKFNGRVQYLIHWKGYGSSDDSWEYLDNLSGCKQMIREFNSTLRDSDSKQSPDGDVPQIATRNQQRQNPETEKKLHKPPHAINKDKIRKQKPVQMIKKTMKKLHKPPHAINKDKIRKQKPVQMIKRKTMEFCK